MWINRTAADVLTSLAKSFPAVVVTGPRQVGKTSLLEKTFPSYNYVSLDVSSHAETAETRPEQFLKLHPPPVIIDEIQYTPSLLKNIKVYIDAHKGKMGQFLISGSQSLSLMESISESMAGRTAVIPLLSLSAQELYHTVQDKDELSITFFMWKGGYPALWAQDPLPDRNRWYQGYVATYLERDVRNMLNIGKLRDFERFIRACAHRTGGILNMSELGRDVGISHSTAREWLGLLHASHQVILLEPYYRSMGKRLVKSPKLYFTDTGLASFLAGFQTAEAQEISSMAGALWENHVISQWLRWRDTMAPAANLWFWQNQQRQEVDLVIEYEGKLLPIECKFKEKPKTDDISNLLKFKKIYGNDVRHGWIACITKTPYAISDGIAAVNGFMPWGLDPIS